MFFRNNVLFLFLILVSLIAVCPAKNKKKQVLPDEVLRAQTALVVIRPDAGEPLNNPMANRNAQDDVENAMTKWGRFRLVTSALDADLIVAVRRGHEGGPVINRSPADNRPIVYQGSEGGSRTAGKIGRPPDLSGIDEGNARGPRLGGEVGASEDSLEVFRGGVENPLDAPPVWRYMSKDGLRPPQVPAVDEFRKEIAESEKQSQQKH